MPPLSRGADADAPPALDPAGVAQFLEAFMGEALSRGERAGVVAFLSEGGQQVGGETGGRGGERAGVVAFLSEGGQQVGGEMGGRGFYN